MTGRPPAVRGRRAEIILTPAGQVVSRVASLAPGLTSDILHLVQRLALPARTGPARPGPARTGPARMATRPTPGYRLDPAMSRKAFDRLTVLG